MSDVRAHARTPRAGYTCATFPEGVEVGDPEPQRTIGTYPFSGAYEQTKALGEQPGMKVVELVGRWHRRLQRGARRDGRAMWRIRTPTSRYEVFDPTPGAAAQLIEIGQDRSRRLRRSPAPGPMSTLLAPWIGFPLVLLALSLGCGLVVERGAGMRLPGALVLPVGFAAVVVSSLIVTMHGATAELAAPAVVAMAVAGFVLARKRPRPAVDWWALAAACGVFAVYAAPVVLSGEATFPGYIKLDDDSTFLANLDRVMERGRRRGARAFVVPRDAPAAPGEGISPRRRDAGRRRPRNRGGEALALPPGRRADRGHARTRPVRASGRSRRPTLASGPSPHSSTPVGSPLRLRALGRPEGGRRGGRHRAGIGARVARAEGAYRACAPFFRSQSRARGCSAC